MEFLKHFSHYNLNEAEEKIIEEMPDIDMDDISCIYVGKPGRCMCGCSGEYYYTSKNKIWSGKNRGYSVSEKEINDEKVAELYKKMKKAKANVEVLQQDSPGNGTIFTVAEIFPYTTITVTLKTIQYTLYKIEK